MALQRDLAIYAAKERQPVGLYLGFPGKLLILNGGEYRNRTGVHGFAIRI